MPPPIYAYKLQDVLDQMSDGEFLIVFLNKGPTAPDDEVVFYPRDENGRGMPMSEISVQTFLGGWLQVNPVPSQFDDMGVVKRDASGQPIPSMTVLQWFAEWLRRTANAASKKGLARMASDQITDPAP